MYESDEPCFYDFHVDVSTDEKRYNTREGIAYAMFLPSDIRHEICTHINNIPDSVVVFSIPESMKEQLEYHLTRGGVFFATRGPFIESGSEEQEETMKDTVDALYDDPEFAGVIFQHWHCSGDERMENGSPSFASRHVGRDLIESILERARTTPDYFTARPVFYSPK